MEFKNGWGSAKKPQKEEDRVRHGWYRGKSTERRGKSSPRGGGLKNQAQGEKQPLEKGKLRWKVRGGRSRNSHGWQ